MAERQEFNEVIRAAAATVVVSSSRKRPSEEQGTIELAAATNANADAPSCLATTRTAETHPTTAADNDKDNNEGVMTMTMTMLDHPSPPPPLLLYTTTPLDSESIPTYYTVRVPVVAPDSMTSTIIRAAVDSTLSSSSSSTTATDDDGISDNKNTENNSKKAADTGATVLVVERRRNSQLRIQKTALAWHLVTCLFLCTMTLLVDFKVATATTTNSTGAYYGGNNIEMLLIFFVVFLLLLLPLNVFALLYIYMLVASSLSCCWNRCQTVLRITMDKQTGRLTVATSVTGENAQQEQQQQHDMPGFIDISTIQSMRCQRLLLYSRQTQKRYITYNLLYKDKDGGTERIMFRGWSQLQELLFLQQEIESFLGLTLDVPTTTATTCRSSNNSNMINTCDSSQSCGNNNLHRSRFMASCDSSSDNNKRNHDHADSSSMRRMSSSSSASSFATSTCFIGQHQANDDDAIIRPAYLKIQRPHTISAPDNMVVSHTSTQMKTMDDGENHKSDNRNDANHDAENTTHHERRDVLVVEWKRNKNQTTTSRPFSWAAWWGFLLALLLLTMFLVWTSRLTALDETVSLSFLFEPILTVLYVTFFLYSLAVTLSHTCTTTTSAKNSITTTVTVDRARGNIAVVNDSSRNKNSNNSSSMRWSKFLSFFGLARSAKASSPLVIDTRHVKEIVCRRHLVAEASLSARQNNSCCCGGGGHPKHQRERAVVVEICYDVRCRDLNGIEHVIVDKLPRLEEALFLEQEIEKFLGLVADPQDNNEGNV